MAERLLQSRSGAALDVSSAGVRALVGRPIDGPSAQALRELGVDPDGHRARLLTAQLIADSGLVLAAESRHRAAVLQADPLAMRRTFTIREFARLGAGLPDPDGTTLADRVQAVAGLRGWAEPPAPGADEVSDPFGAALPVARQCAAVLSDAVDGVLIALGLGAGRLR